jgi:hypothetical protein
VILTEGRWGQIIEVSNDKGPYKIARVQSEGHEFDVMIVEPSGVQVNPLKESQVWIFPNNTDTGQAVGLALPPPAKRFDQQKEGEAIFANHKQGQFIRMDDDGNIHIRPLAGKKVIIEGVDGGDVELVHKGVQKHTGDREHTGNVAHTGNIQQTGNYTQGGVHIDNNGTHKP